MSYMTEIFLAASLADEIFNRRSSDHLILSGYPYSGKKHIVLEVLKNEVSKKKKEGLTLVFPKNCQWSEEQKKALNELIKLGIKVYQYGDDNIESVCENIEGKTVFLLLPSKINSENGEKEKLKELIDKIKKNHRLIVVTREYNYLYIQNRIERTNFNKQEDVVQKIKKYVSNFLKKNVPGKIPEKNREVIKVVCNEDVARSIVNNLKDENGNKLSEELREKLLKHGKINHGFYKGYYFPRLLVGGDKRLEDIKNEKIDDVEEFEKDWAIDASITTGLGISLEEAFFSSVGELISNSANFIPSIFISVSGGFIASLLIVPILNSIKKKEFGKIVKWASAWKKMPIERKEYIAYHYDILYNLSPGESMKTLEDFFGREDIEKELKKLSDSIISINAKLKEHDEILYFLKRELLSQIGYVRISGKVDDSIMNFLVNNGIKVQLTIQIDKKEMTLPYVNPKSENVQKMFSGEISACIAGLSGSGKSRLLYEVVKKRIADDKVNDIIVLNTNITEEQRKRIEGIEGIKIDPGKISPEGLKELDFPNNLNDGSERKTLVIWDNFGLGLREKDAEDFISVLNLIDDRRNVKYALTLNKDLYSRGVESFNFKNVIDLSKITSYEYVNELLEKWFSSLLGKKYDKMREVASLLYKRWASPQCIYHFINELIENPNLDPLDVARRITNKEFKTYIERQFESLSVPKKNYLAAVKITNIIFNHPTFEKVEEMWKRMKSRNLDDPLSTLKPFLYISQGEIKMHDLYQELFKFSPDQLMAVFDYLKESFKDYKSIYQMIDNVSGDYNLYGLASLIGKYSCEYMSNEELIEILLPFHSVNMPEFFFDMGESFGKNFRSFNYDFQVKIVKLANVVEYIEFAEGLGYGVGSIFDTLKGDVQEKLIELAKENENFANGLGSSIGSIFDTLKGDVQEKLIELAKENKYIIYGLGYGVGSIFGILKENVQEKLIEFAKENENFAYGLGSSIGSIFDTLKGDVQEKLIELAKENENFANGLSYEIGSIFGRLKGDVQEKLIELAKENKYIIYGLGYGIGSIFDTLKEDVQEKLIELAKENENFAYGLGFEIGSIFHRLKGDVQEELIELAKENENFANRLGYGVGSIIDRLKENVQEELIELAKENENFANRLGSGIGRIFGTLKGDVQEELIELAKENENFANRLGSGIGRIFDTLKENVQEELIELAKENENFANGLSYYIGSIFDTLKEDVQEKLIELAKENENFANGLNYDIGSRLGYGVGRIFHRLKGDVQEKLIELAKENKNFANRLGSGIGRIFDTLKENVQEELIELAKENENFANRLGSGIGRIFHRLKGDVQEKLIELAKENENFANGLSYYIGIIFGTLKGDVQEELIELAKENENFANGLGYAVGSKFGTLKGDVQEELIELAKENENFANGLGYAVGSKFDTLEENVQEELIELAKENENFANGLGSGVGSIFNIFHRLKGDVQEELIELAKENENFANGLGYAVGRIFDIFHILKENVQKELIELAKENENFANGLGSGVGSIFGTLKENVQEELIELAKENENFANGLGYAVGSKFDTLEENVQEKLIELAKENENFANGLGSGVGSIFHRLKEDVQRKLKDLVSKNERFDDN
ncbi:MAG: hypothetical protein QXH07_05245 [Thermoplasmata archaeon]